jgi:hypothetical protein
MEQKAKTNYAKGIYLTKRISKNGNPYLELNIKTDDGYKKYICYESKLKDKFGNDTYQIIEKQNQLPF